MGLSLSLLRCVVPVSFLLHEVLLALLVQLVDRGKVVVRSSITFNINSHVFEHFELVSIRLEFKHLGLMLLVEPRHRVLLWLGLGVAEISAVVRLLEKRDVVLVVEILKSAMHVIGRPFIVLVIVLTGTLYKNAIISSDVDYAVRVDVCLELWIVQLCEFLRVHFFFLNGLLFAVFVEYWGLLRGLLRNDVENTTGGLVTSGVSIQYVASVLAVILAKPPPECFIEKVSRDFLFLRVLLEELNNFLFDIENHEVVRFLSLIIFIDRHEFVKLLLELVSVVNWLFFIFCCGGLWFLPSNLFIIIVFIANGGFHLCFPFWRWFVI